jgi:uncharacterized protein
MIKALGSKHIIDSDRKTHEFYMIIKDMTENLEVLKMKDFRHHYYSDCYQHSLNVAYYSYIICKNLGFDYRSAARGAFLHDFFLYERKKRERKKGEPSHNFYHPHIALKNAKKSFFISEIEEDIILNHMWPLAVSFPKHKEAYVVTAVDKYIAVAESSIFAYQKLTGKSSKPKS